MRQHVKRFSMISITLMPVHVFISLPYKNEYLLSIRIYLFLMKFVYHLTRISHCSSVMPYCIGDLGQHLIKQWLVAWLEENKSLLKPLFNHTPAFYGARRLPKATWNVQSNRDTNTMQYRFSVGFPIRKLESRCVRDYKKTSNVALLIRSHWAEKFLFKQRKYTV